MVFGLERGSMPGRVALAAAMNRDVAQRQKLLDELDRALAELDRLGEAEAAAHLCWAVDILRQAKHTRDTVD